MKKSGIIFAALAMMFSCLSCNNQSGKLPDVRKGQYWKDQVLIGILPYWTKHARDNKNGGFHTTLDSVWKP